MIDSTVVTRTILRQTLLEESRRIHAVLQQQHKVRHFHAITTARIEYLSKQYERRLEDYRRKQQQQRQYYFTLTEDLAQLQRSHELLWRSLTSSTNEMMAACALVRQNKHTYVEAKQNNDLLEDQLNRLLVADAACQADYQQQMQLLRSERLRLSESQNRKSLLVERVNLLKLNNCQLQQTVMQTNYECEQLASVRCVELQRKLNSYRISYSNHVNRPHEYKFTEDEALIVEGNTQSDKLKDQIDKQKAKLEMITKLISEKEGLAQAYEKSLVEKLYLSDKIKEQRRDKTAGIAKAQQQKATLLELSKRLKDLMPILKEVRFEKKADVSSSSGQSS